MQGFTLKYANFIVFSRKVKWGLPETGGESCMRNTTFIGLVWFRVSDVPSCNACWMLQFSLSARCLFLSQWGMCWSFPRISAENSTLLLLPLQPKQKARPLPTCVPLCRSSPCCHVWPTNTLLPHAECFTSMTAAGTAASGPVNVCCLAWYIQ